MSRLKARSWRARSGIFCPFDNYIVVGKFRGSELPPAVLKEFPSVQPDKRYKLATTDFTAANQTSANQLSVSGLKFPEKVQRDAVIDLGEEEKSFRPGADWPTKHGQGQLRA